MEINVSNVFFVFDCKFCGNRHSLIRDCRKFHLHEVIEGLKDGRSFKHYLDGYVGWEYVRPIDSGCFEHSVVGENNGGWGGVAELTFDILSNNRWAEYNWVEV